MAGRGTSATRRRGRRSHQTDRSGGRRADPETDPARSEDAICAGDGPEPPGTPVQGHCIVGHPPPPFTHSAESRWNSARFLSVLPPVGAPIARNSLSGVITEALLGVGRRRTASGGARTSHAGRRPPVGGAADSALQIGVLRQTAPTAAAAAAAAEEAGLCRSSQAMQLPRPKAALQAC